MPRRTQAERSETTRRAIVEAAAKRMTRDGIARTTLDDVADDAGVTKGALYHHFASKDDLIVSVIDSMATIDPAAEARTRPAPERRQAMVERSTAGLLTLELQAFNHELYALALRNHAVREALARRSAAAIDEIVATQDTPLDFVVAAAALVEGLSTRRSINPDLVPDALYERALNALATMLP
jgi:AcrR family transcriptional regulator